MGLLWVRCSSCHPAISVKGWDGTTQSTNGWNVDSYFWSGYTVNQSIDHIIIFTQAFLLHLCILIICTFRSQYCFGLVLSCLCLQLDTNELDLSRYIVSGLIFLAVLS